MQEQSEMLGELLKKTREAKKITIRQVAERLKLSESKINAIEADEPALMQSDIARGYLRSYARLLDLDEQQLLKSHAIMFPSQQADIHVTTEALQKLDSQQRLIKTTMRTMVIGVGLIVLAVGVSYFWYQYAPMSSQSAQTDPNASNQTSAEAPDALDKEALVAEVTGQNDVADKTPELANQTGPVKQGEIEIKLVFTQQSWTSVHDASNKSIYNKLADANSQELVSGNPPLKLVIGNAGGTKLYLRGNEVNLEQYTVNNVARLNLE